MAAVLIFPPATNAAPLTQIVTADAVLMPEGMPAESRRVSLRHRWDADYPGRDGIAIYTLRIPVEKGSETRSILLERVGNQATLLVNGVVVEELSGANYSTFDASKIGRSVQLHPAADIGEGSVTRVDIRVTMQALRGGGLGRVSLGDSAAIAQMLDRQRLLVQVPAAAQASCMILMGGLALGLWWRQRESLYSCFGIAALCGALRPMDQLLQVAPLPWPLWGAVLAIAYTIQLGMMARFVLIIIQKADGLAHWATNVVIAVVAALASLSFALGVPALWTVGLLVFILLGLFCLALLAVTVAKDRRLMPSLLLLTGGVTILAGIHDLIFIRIGAFGGSDLVLTHHALFGFVLILASLVVTRYNQSVDDFRRLNQQLSHRIAEKEAALRTAFESLRQQQEERAVLDERQRIMREIHDGVGSQLVGLLGMVRSATTTSDDIEAQVQSALDEMRMAIDSLQPVHGDLTTVLATLRYRLQPRLEAAGIDVVWAVEALPDLPHSPMQQMLQVQRILLEAFTNVLKHARATQVIVEAFYDEQPVPCLHIGVKDNGIGLPAGLNASPHKGYGMTNMRNRALHIKAILNVYSPREAALPYGLSGHCSSRPLTTSSVTKFLDSD